MTDQKTAPKKEKKDPSGDPNDQGPQRESADHQDDDKPSNQQTRYKG